MSKVKIPDLRAKEIERVLNKLGYVFKRQKGSHTLFIKGNVAITLIYHSHPLKKGTIHSIIKATGLSVEEFLDFL